MKSQFKKWFNKAAILSIGALSLPFLGFANSEDVSDQTPAAIEQVENTQLTQHIEATLTVMRDRLALMENVAKQKWNDASPIEDKEAENAMVSALCAKCEAHGLTHEQTREFFEAQNRAAKLVQINVFESWVKEDIEKHPESIDYATEIQPKLDQMNDQLLVHLRNIIPHLEKSDLSEHIKTRAKELITTVGCNDEVRHAAIEPLLDITQSH